MDRTLLTVLISVAAGFVLALLLGKVLLPALRALKARAATTCWNCPFWKPWNASLTLHQRRRKLRSAADAPLHNHQLCDLPSLFPMTFAAR